MNGQILVVIRQILAYLLAFVQIFAQLLMFDRFFVRLLEFVQIMAHFLVMILPRAYVPLFLGLCLSFTLFALSFRVLYNAFYPMIQMAHYVL